MSPKPAATGPPSKSSRPTPPGPRPSATSRRPPGAIQGEKTKADADALKHVQAGVKEAEDAKRKGDEDARKEKEKAKEESSGGGFFGWVASKAKALYDKVKDGITNIFNKVRSAITTAINKAKEIAHSVIDRAVKFVADKIKAVASKLIALGDKLIPGFKALRTKFKNWIVARVKQAVAALNRIVTAVKDGIRRVMNAVGNALKAGLEALKKGINAAINAVKNAVKAAIEKAKALIATLAQFAVIIKDVAANPGAWIRNLGAAVMDGIRNHLWVALKQAISQWFNDKVEQLLGLGKSVWGLLTKGGISIAQVGKMAWEAIKAAIPPALIMILVERLVSMIVPAAGAVMAIVQGLMAAWGAIQRILAAIDRFIAFLKAVKSGNAGPAFAQALAAAAVAVIEFVSQFLLRKIAGAASKIAGKIKAIAQKIGKRLMAAMKKVGKRVKKGYNKLKAKAKQAKEKIFGPKKKKTKQDEAKEKQAKLDKAATALRPKIAALLAKGATGLVFKARLAMWKVMHRLSSLTATGSGDTVEIVATVNPRATVGTAAKPSRAKLRLLVHQAAEKVLANNAVLEQVEAQRGHRREHPNDPTRISPGAGLPAHVQRLRERGGRVPKTGHVQEYDLGGNKVREQQKKGQTNAVVMNIGEYQDLIPRLKDTGMDNKAIAVTMRTFVQTGTLPRSLKPEDQALISNLTLLMFGRESHRNPGNVAMAPMTLDLIVSGKMSFNNAFGIHEPGGADPRRGNRGQFPMSMEGATAAARGLAAEEERPIPGKGYGGTVADRAELKRREISLVTKWVNLQLKSQAGLLSTGEAAILAYIERKVLDFYAIR